MNLSKATHLRPSTLIGIGISAAALVGFVAWTLFIQPWADPPHPPEFDWAWAHDMREYAKDHAFLRPMFIFFTMVGGIRVMVCVGACGILGSLWYSQKPLAIGWFVAVVGGALINLALKDTMVRPRPPTEFRDTFVTETNGSYPSGHAMGSTIGLGMLAYIIWHYLRRRWAKILLVVGVIAVILLVGLSRIFLRAHWFSDVIGGFAIGTCWLWLCITWLELRWSAANQRT